MKMLITNTLINPLRVIFIKLTESPEYLDIKHAVKHRDKHAGKQHLLL